VDELEELSQMEPRRAELQRSFHGEHGFGRWIDAIGRHPNSVNAGSYLGAATVRAYAAAHGFPPEVDSEVAVHLLRAMVDMAGQRVLLDPVRYPPERMTAALDSVLDVFNPP